MKTPRILIVDDDIDLLAALARSLKDELACEIATSTGGDEALSLMEQGSFDVLIFASGAFTRD